MAKKAKRNWKKEFFLQCEIHKKQLSNFNKKRAADNKLIEDLLAKQKPDVKHPAGTVIITGEEWERMKASQIDAQAKYENAAIERVGELRREIVALVAANGNLQDQLKTVRNDLRTTLEAHAQYDPNETKKLAAENDELKKQRDRYERDFQMEQERRTAVENQVRVLTDKKVVDEATIKDQKARHDQQVKTLAAVKAGYETRIDSLLKDLDVALADRVRIKQSFTCTPGWTPEAEAKYRGTIELKVSDPDPKLIYCQKIIQAVRVLVQSENEGENNVQA